MEEISKALASEEAIFQKYTLQQAMHDPAFGRELDNNPKVIFDRNLRTFALRHKFTDVRDLTKKLFAEKIGVIEDQDLYDDIDKDKLEAIKLDGLVREIVIQEKKSKPAISYLFSKDQDDEVEKLNYDERTPKELRLYWEKIDRDDLERRNFSKRTVQAVISRDPDMNRPLRSTKRKRFRDDENINRWYNNHILPEIEEAMKMLTKRPPTIKKGRGLVMSQKTY